MKFFQRRESETCEVSAAAYLYLKFFDKPDGFCLDWMFQSVLTAAQKNTGQNKSTHDTRYEDNEAFSTPEDNTGSYKINLSRGLKTNFIVLTWKIHQNRWAASPGYLVQTNILRI